MAADPMVEIDVAHAKCDGILGDFAGGVLFQQLFRHLGHLGDGGGRCLRVQPGLGEEGLVPEEAHRGGMEGHGVQRAVIGVCVQQRAENLRVEFAVSVHEIVQGDHCVHGTHVLHVAGEDLDHVRIVGGVLGLDQGLQGADGVVLVDGGNVDARRGPGVLIEVRDNFIQGLTGRTAAVVPEYQFHRTAGGLAVGAAVGATAGAVSGAAGTTGVSSAGRENAQAQKYCKSGCENSLHVVSS